MMANNHYVKVSNDDNVRVARQHSHDLAAIAVIKSLSYESLGSPV